MKVCLNGRLRDKEELSELWEPGFLFGWGLFETLRVYQGQPAFLTQHLKRLNQGLVRLGLAELELDWQAAIARLLVRNHLPDAYVRITCYRQRQGTGYIIYADKFAYYTPQTYQKGFTSLISPYSRERSDIYSKLKALSYLPNRLSWYEAQKKGKQEALVLNRKGFLVGGARSNLFMVKGSRVITPPLAGSAFCGITRLAVIKIVKDLGLKFRESEITRPALFSADEVFLTSSLLEVMPLVECEDKPVGGGVAGEITKKIHAAYKKIVGADPGDRRESRVSPRDVRPESIR